VTKVTTKFAKLQILTIGDIPLKSDFPAIIRQAEIRLTLVDSVELHKCFRPGDIVRAEVVHLYHDRGASFRPTINLDFSWRQEQLLCLDRKK
jgi:exosome complex component CSL4